VANLKTIHQSNSAATVDGNNGLGPVVASYAMDLALTKAKREGSAAVAVRRSNDFGMAGFYARRALERQMIGIAMSNASPSVLPPGGTRSMLGTNPLAIAIPTSENVSPFVLDMSTSVVSKGKLEEAKRDKRSIPEGWALDSENQPTTDPGAALEAQRYLPLGSRPETGSHKGYGLALAIDILSGVLSGGGFGLELAGAEGDKPGVAQIGHFFIALKIRAFGPYVNFRNRIDELLKKLTGKTSSKANRIYYPGEPEFEMEQIRRAHGIPIPGDLSVRLEGTANGLDLADVWEHLLESRK
jgi:LDH2 family malate/lactate/ureidoglycolate dehydrogenase